MAFIFQCCKMNLKKYLNLTFLTIILTYIIVICAYNVVAIYEGGNAISVGMLSQEKTANISAQFTQYAGEAIRIHAYDDLEAMKKDVLLNRIQAGYVIGDPPQKVQAIVSPFSFAAKITNIMLATILIQHDAGEAGYEVVKNYFEGIDPYYIKSEIQKISDAYLLEGSRIDVKIEYVNDLPLGFARDRKSGSIYINILFSALICLVFGLDVIKTKNEGFYKTFIVMKINRVQYFTGSFLAVFFIAALFFLLTSFVLLL